MKLNKIKKFLIPNKKKIIIFMCFLILMYLAHIISWSIAMNDTLNDGIDTQKSFLYLSRYLWPLLILWYIITSPLILIYVIIDNYVYPLSGLKMSLWTWRIFQIIYIYLLSCLITNFLKRKKK